MSEFGYVEQPVIEWLSGKANQTPPDSGLGWTYRDEDAMAVFNRPLTDPLVEPILIKAIKDINDHVTTDDQALRAIQALRKAMGHPDKLTANRQTLNLLQNGATVVLNPGEGGKTVEFIAFEPDRQHLNDFTATNQFKVQGAKGTREDTVLLVNGIPLVVAEYKSVVASGHDWREAVRQLHRYQVQAPLLLSPNLFCIAADEFDFRYGTVLFHDASKEDIETHMDTWGLWLSLYPDQKGYWNTPEADNAEDPLEVSVRGMLRLAPCHVLDYLKHFWVFETKKGKTIKKVARYQQFEAANDIFDRVTGSIGKDGDDVARTGLIWHTQGSGKSLTMVYTGNKLRKHPSLDNPTVLIVVDRRDLKTQLSEDFESCDYDNVEKALGVEDLKTKLRTGWRGTLVTTLQSFQRMGDLAPIDRENVICLIDEAHRSQKGIGTESPAMTMRVKLPKAFRFGFSGTPIDKTMVNTHREFGPTLDGKQERYMSFYGYKRAIKDGATLPVHYIRDKVPFKVDEEPLNVSFEEMCDEAELTDEEVKTLIQQKRARWKEIASHPDRVKIVLKKMLDHFLEHPDPNGLKAQLVCVDRPACVVYKDLLDEMLRERGLPTEWCDVIFSEGQNDEPELARFHYGKAKQDDLIDWFKLTEAQWEQANREVHGEARSKWRPPLKILVVCDRLLTGFDAPVEQVMYLDKPLRDHTLLQAIARTNRPFPALGKKVGMVIDYFGVLDNLEKALNYDENEIEDALIDWKRLQDSVEAEVTACMAPFEGIKIADTRECLLAALRRLSDPEKAKTFETSFRSLSRLWEALSPDPCLYDHRFTYNWLCGVFVAYRRRKTGGRSTFNELAAKTRELVRQNTTFQEVVDALPVFRIDENTITAIGELPTASDKAAALEAALEAELSEAGNGFAYKLLGERLAKLKERKDVADAAVEARLKQLETLTEAAAAIKSEPDQLGLDPKYEYPVFLVLRDDPANVSPDLAVELAKRIVARLKAKHLLTPGWSARQARQEVEQTILIELWDEVYTPFGIDPSDPFPPLLKAVVAALTDGDSA